MTAQKPPAEDQPEDDDPAHGASIFDEDHDEVSQNESDASTAKPEMLKVSLEGETAVIGFPRVRAHDDECIKNFRDQLLQILGDAECKRFKFDVSGIPVLPSAMLGLLLSVMKHGCEVEIYNPSPHVRETLEITRLDTILTISGPVST